MKISTEEHLMRILNKTWRLSEEIEGVAINETEK